MKNIITAFIFLLCISEVNAQKWFTPQAKWYYGTREMTANGVIEISKRKDTLINNKDCIKFGMKYKNPYSQQWESLSSTSDLILFDDTTNKKQYIVLNGKFHVLYDFGRNVGDTVFTPATWDASGWVSNPDSGAWSVIDTVGFDTFNGVPFKTMHYREVTKPDGSKYHWSFDGKIVEGIGNIYTPYPWLNRSFNDMGHPSPLRCFENEYIYIKLTDLPCDTSIDYVSVKEIFKHELAQLSPNPFQAILELNFKQPLKEGSLLILNHLGKTIREYSIEPFNEKLSLNLTQLAPGLYYCRVISQGQTQTFKIIKR